MATALRIRGRCHRRKLLPKTTRPPFGYVPDLVGLSEQQPGQESDLERRVRLPMGRWMDNDYTINLEEILRTINTAEVMRVRFLLLDKRLLIDTRFNDVEGPLLKIVPRAGSSEETFRNLKRLRPRFALPERMTAIWWPKYINTLHTSGVWNGIVEKVSQAGFESSIKQCEDVLEELRQLEHEEINNAISGKGFQTIWQRSDV